VWPTPVIPALWASLGYTSEFKASLDLVWRPSLSQKKINPSFNFFFSFFFFGGGGKWRRRDNYCGMNSGSLLSLVIHPFSQFQFLIDRIRKNLTKTPRSSIIFVV
jgi:hypothetical protein